MIYTLEDFIREYSNIVNMGWVKTHRAGPTGIVCLQCLQELQSRAVQIHT